MSTTPYMSEGAGGQARKVSTQRGYASRPVPQSATSWVAWVPPISFCARQAKVEAGKPHGQEQVQHTWCV